MNNKSLIKYVKGFRRAKEAIKDTYKILKNIQNPNVISIYNIIENTNDFFLHMEYVSGQTLNQYIKREYYNIEDKNLTILKNILMDIASTIDFLNNNNLIHTDIIGANIIVTDSLKIKIIDFDFSIICDNNSSNTISIDIYSFIVMVSQILYEQIYLNEKYSLFNNEDVQTKQLLLKDFLTKKGTSEYKSCIEFMNKTFGELKF